MRREDVKKMGGGYKEMTGYQKKGYKKISDKGELASEKDIVQYSKGDYKSRYNGLLSPKDQIVEENFKPTYRDSRYE